MFKSLAIVFSAVFLASGILGLLPAATPLHSDGMRYLLGLFMVGSIHTAIHLITGIAAFAGAFSSEKYAKLYFKVFGIFYAFITVIGLIQRTTVFGFIMVNLADNLLHLGFTVALLSLGFGIRYSRKVAVTA